MDNAEKSLAGMTSLYQSMDKFGAMCGAGADSRGQGYEPGPLSAMDNKTETTSTVFPSSRETASAEFRSKTQELPFSRSSKGSLNASLASFQSEQRAATTSFAHYSAKKKIGNNPACFDASVASRKRPLRCGEYLFTGAFDSGNMESVDLVHLEDPATGLRTEVYRIRVNSDSVSCDYRMRYYLGICHASDAAGADSFGTVASSGSWQLSASTGGVSSINIEIVNLNPMLKCYTRNLAPLVSSFRSGTHDLNLDPPANSWARLNVSEYQTFSFCSNLHIKFRVDVAMGNTCMLTSHYPHSYSSCQQMLRTYELTYPVKENPTADPSPSSIYFRRELLVRSLEGARCDLLTVTSNRGRATEREALPIAAWRPGMNAKQPGLLFPERTDPRPYRFPHKRVIFLTGRVHPGETPGSHVLNGLIRFLLDTTDPLASLLRDTFVFKIVPMLNPDGVMRGNFRCDSRGVNLNRMYLNPSQDLHPTIFALKETVRASCLFKIPDAAPPEKVDRRGRSLDRSRNKSNASRRVTKKAPQTKHYFGTSDRAVVGFVDFHSMSMRPGTYSMANGTSIATGKKAHLMDSLNHVFAKLCEVCCPHFNYAACTFSGSGGRRRKRRKSSASSVTAGGDADSLLSMDFQSLMLAHNKGQHRKEDSEAVADWRRIKEDAGRGNPEGHKGGAGRVCIAKEFGIVHAYTIEASCNVSQASAGLLANGYYNFGALESLYYLPSHHAQVGRAIALTFLELNGTMPREMSCLSETRFENVHDMVYAFRTQKNPITLKKHSASSTHPGFGSYNARVNVEQQIKAQKLLLEQMQVSKGTGRSVEEASSLTMAVASGNQTKNVQSRGSMESKSRDKKTIDEQENVNSKMSSNQRNADMKNVIPAQSHKGRCTSIKRSDRKPTSSVEDTFHSASQHSSWGSRYRMLEDGGNSEPSGRALKNSSKSRKTKSAHGSSALKFKAKTKASNPISGKSSTRWGSGGSLAAQLAQARASILDERLSLGLQENTTAPLTHIGEASYRFDIGDRLDWLSESKKSKNKIRRKRAHGKKSVKEKPDGTIRGVMHSQGDDSSSKLRSTVSASSLFSQIPNRKDLRNPLMNRRRHKGLNGRKSQRVNSKTPTGNAASAKVPIAPIPQKSARFLSPLLGSHSQQCMQYEEQ